MPQPAPLLPNKRRVAITGVGAISALGLDARDFWRSLSTGQGGIGPIESVDTSQLRFKNGAQIKGYDAAQHFPKGTALLDRFAQLAVVSAREAVADAKIQFTPELSSRSVVVTGSSIGGQDSEDAAFASVYRDGTNRVPPFTIPRAMANAGASHISIEFGISGPSLTISTACSSSNQAIGLAFWMVRSGQADLAITGGSEAPFSFGLLKAWEAMRIVSTDTCRPFSKDRKGLILGEGGAMLVLEDWERAVARGANIYAEFVGFGMSSDAYHSTAGNVQGPVAAMRASMLDAGVDASSVGYVNAHGTGTMLNDATESAAIREVFGKDADRVWVSSTKSMHGHALGAAGALEAAATVLALRHQTLPPNCNFTEPDPQCDVRLVLNEVQKAEVEYAMSNSFAFGGINAAVLFRRNSDQRSSR